MTTVTLEMPDEVRAVIDEARGNQDVAAFLLTVGERAARRRVARRAGELTAADHIRMADEGEASAHSVEESERRVFAAIDALAEARRRGSRQRASGGERRRSNAGTRLRHPAP